MRPELVVGPDDGALFLTNLGESFTPNRLTQMVRNYVDAVEIGKRGACHRWDRVDQCPADAPAKASGLGD